MEYNQSEFFMDMELSDVGFRLLGLINHLMQQDATYELSRAGMAQEWKKLKGRPATRTFVRGWNELKQLGYIYKYGIRKGGVDGFGCSWGVRNYEEAKKWRESNVQENSPIAHNEKVHFQKNTKSDICKTKTKKTKELQTNSLKDEVKEIFYSYLVGDNNRRVRIKDTKLKIQRIIEPKEITERFKECERNGIVEVVFERAIVKIQKYYSKIKYKTSYITATLFNMVKEYEEQPKEEVTRNIEISPNNKEEKKKCNPYATKFHNFEQRNTDYDSLLKKLNSSYY